MSSQPVLQAGFSRRRWTAGRRCGCCGRRERPRRERRGRLGRRGRRGRRGAGGRHGRNHTFGLMLCNQVGVALLEVEYAALIKSLLSLNTGSAEMIALWPQSLNGFSDQNRVKTTTQREGKT